jgi:glycosyltransferase involved in cell wall biosynthesis
MYMTDIKGDGVARKLSSISLIFPAYNEEKNIEAAIAKGREALGKYAEKIEIIVVDDGSSDQTGDIIDRLGSGSTDIVPVHHPKNRGYGAALCTGFYRASGDYVFFSDSDLQFDLDEVGKLVEWIGQFDIVTGYRVKRADPWNRKLNAWAWNRLVRLLLGVKVRDIDCAFKLFRRQIFDIIKLDSAGAMVNTELLALAGIHGLTIKEVPVSHYSRTQGQQTGANLKVILKAFRELFSMYGRLKNYKPVPYTKPADTQLGSEQHSGTSTKSI